MNMERSGPRSVSSTCRPPRPPPLFPVAPATGRGDAGWTGFLAPLGQSFHPTGEHAVSSDLAVLSPEPHRTTTTRKPLLLLRLSGVLLLRLEDARLSRLSLFQEPPRNTRFRPRRRLSREESGH
jgi:hypothetical protein